MLSFLKKKFTSDNTKDQIFEELKIIENSVYVIRSNMETDSQKRLIENKKVYVKLLKKISLQLKNLREHIKTFV